MVKGSDRCRLRLTYLCKEEATAGATGGRSRLLRSMNNQRIDSRNKAARQSHLVPPSPTNLRKYHVGKGMQKLEDVSVLVEVHRLYDAVLNKICMQSVHSKK